mgnify:CR=1 FL=1
MLWKKRLNKNVNRNKLSKSLTANVKLLKEILSDDDTLITRFVENQTNSKIKGCILFFDGMVDKEIINENIIEPLVRNNSLKEKADTIDIIMSQVILTHKIEKATEINNLIEALYNGEAVLFFDGFKEAIIVFSKGGETRQITEPETERVLRGPREGFTE